MTVKLDLRPRTSVVFLIWFVALAGVLTANGWKGYWPGVQGWGLPYWFVDYRDGFIRRGLVGQLFQLAAGRQHSVDTLTRPVLAIHLISIGFTAVASALLAASTAARLKGWRLLGFFGFAAWVFAAQVWPSMTYNVGYLDVIVIAMAVAAALLMRSGRVIATGVLIAAGPFVHEYFVFLVPFILAAGLPEDPGEAKAGEEALFSIDYVPPGPPARTFVTLGAVGLLSAGLVTFASSSAASLAQIARMPLPAEEKQILATVTFTQSIGQSISGMIELLFRDPGYTLFNGLFFLVPAFAASAGLLFWRTRPNRNNMLQVVAGLFPVLALLVAWDLSRLLVLANLTAGFLFLLAAERRAAPAPAQRAPRGGMIGYAAAGVSVVAALSYGMLPMVYSYFQPSPTTFRYPLAFDRSVTAQYIKQPLRALWGEKPSVSGFSDLTCQMTSDRAKTGQAAVCSPVVGEDESLTAPISLSHGAYRFQLALEPTGACNDGRAMMSITGPQGPISSVGFRLGGRLVAQVDVQFPDPETDIVAQITGVAGDRCVRVGRLTVSPLAGGR